MKRIILSILGGIFIPIQYMVILVCVAIFLKNQGIDVGTKTSPIYYLEFVAAIPIFWAFMLIENFYPITNAKASVFILLIFPFSNFPVYFGLTYLLLWLFSSRKKLKIKQIDSPPQPPNFE